MIVHAMTDDIFKYILREHLACAHFDSNVAHVFAYLGFNSQYVSIDSVNGLASNNFQVITLTNNDPVPDVISRAFQKRLRARKSSRNS